MVQGKSCFRPRYAPLCTRAMQVQQCSAVCEAKTVSRLSSVARAWRQQGAWRHHVRKPTSCAQADILMLCHVIRVRVRVRIASSSERSMTLF
eukprot:363276-Chlamydomonas_euryale.AAC.10